MSRVLSKFNKFSATKELLDNENFTYVWDKKLFDDENYFDLKDFANFFKIKNFRDFEKICPKEYKKYQLKSNQIRNWIKTFEKISDVNFNKYNPISSQMALEFLGVKNDLFYAWVEKMRHKPIWELYEAYYNKHLESFRTQKKMSYDILTKEGIKQIDLDFAENFRFKAKHNTFNLFNMPTHNRNIVIPQKENHFIYMVDFRQFEFRTFLMLVGADVDFSKNELYQQIGEKIGIKENIKLELISYLYSNRQDKKIKKFIDKDKIMDNIREESFVWGEYPVYLKNEFDKNKKIHTIIQTISYFIYLKKFNKVLKLLDDFESKLIFPLHDAMIFSISEKEIQLIKSISDLLSDEIYKVKNYYGKNLLEIKELI